MADRSFTLSASLPAATASGVIALPLKFTLDAALPTATASGTVNLPLKFTLSAELPGATVSGAIALPLKFVLDAVFPAATADFSAGVDSPPANTFVLSAAFPSPTASFQVVNLDAPKTFVLEAALPHASFYLPEGKTFSLYAVVPPAVFVPTGALPSDLPTVEFIDDLEFDTPPDVLSLVPESPYYVPDPIPAADDDNMTNTDSAVPPEGDVSGAAGTSQVLYNGGYYPEQPTGFGLEVYDAHGNVLLSSRKHAVALLTEFEFSGAAGNAVYNLPDFVEAPFVLASLVVKKSKGVAPLITFEPLDGYTRVHATSGTADCTITIIGT